MYCSLFCVFPPACAYCRSSARKRFNPSMSCLTADWVQPSAAACTEAASAAANTGIAATDIITSTADRTKVMRLALPQLSHQISLAANVGQAEITTQVVIRKLRVFQAEESKYG